MSLYKVDRVRLEAESTEEIIRILAEEREDYTPEAIRIFEEILEARGVKRGGKTVGPAASLPKRAPARSSHDTEELLIRNPGDAVHVLNNLLKGVLNGSLDPQVGQTASNMVMAILRAMEHEFMTDSQEES